ncbi:MAG: hypothetical protein DRP34_02305, partial [Thermodesulfobacteriota bacterium]
LNVSPIFLETILQDLEKDDFIAIKDDEVFFTKPLQKIKISNVIGLDSVEESSELPEMSNFTKKISNIFHNVSQITLEDLLKI